LEPFITPALYQKYSNAIDEWTLSTAMAADTASGGISQLETHYQTFIVRCHPFQKTGLCLIQCWLADRGRFCSDRRRRSQLDSSPYRFLGYRDVAGGTFPSQDVVEVRSQGVRLGSEIWYSHHARSSLLPRVAERVRISLIAFVVNTERLFFSSRYNHSGQFGIVNMLNGVMVSLHKDFLICRFC
jgi:hypothetical protein